MNLEDKKRINYVTSFDNTVREEKGHQGTPYSLTLSCFPLLSSLFFLLLFSQYVALFRSISPVDSLTASKVLVN